jgi:hypothetical protein
MCLEIGYDFQISQINMNTQLKNIWKSCFKRKDEKLPPPRGNGSKNHTRRMREENKVWRQE